MERILYTRLPLQAFVTMSRHFLMGIGSHVYYRCLARLDFSLLYTEYRLHLNAAR